MVIFMAGLPKKYAKMGFKRGWKTLKASKSKKAKVYKGSTSKTRMAKRGRKRTHSTTRRRSSKRKEKTNIASTLSTIVYGIARRPIAQKILPKLAINGKLPLGDYTNEALFGGAAHILPYIIKGKQTRDVCAPIKTIELASAAEQAFIDVTQKGTSGLTGQTGYVN